MKYSYKIKPVNALGYGGYGNAVSGVSMKQPTISYVKSVKAGQLKVAWKSVTGAGSVSYTHLDMMTPMPEQEEMV